MTPLPIVRAVKGCGLVGDRWYRSNDPLTRLARLFNARFKNKKFSVTSVSLITAAAVREANEELEILCPGNAFTSEETRRNLVIEGALDLNSLLGKYFSVGNIKMFGTMLCTPCRLPPKRAGKLVGVEHLFKTAFENRGGLRAQILNTGTISLNDLVTFVPYAAKNYILAGELAGHRLP